MTYNGIRLPAKVLGVTSEYFQLYNIGLEAGSYFSQEQELNSMAVCIIGHNVKTRLFQQNEAIGQFIKFGANWVKVVGVLEQSASEATKPIEEEQSSGTASTARSGSLGTIGSESMGMQGYDDGVHSYQDHVASRKQSPGYHQSGIFQWRRNCYGRRRRRTSQDCGQK